MPHTKLILETRYDPVGEDGKKDKNRKFPVRLRISEGKERYYISVPEKKFTRDEWVTMHPKKNGRIPEDLKDELTDLNDIESKARKDMAKLPKFSISSFKKLHENKGDGDTLKEHFQMYITELWNGNQVKSAGSYTCSMNSWEKFKKGVLITNMDAGMLKRYESWMVKEGNGQTTISMYTRNTRTIIRRAIVSGNFPNDLASYPFGKQKDGKFQIPQPLSKKLQLTREQVGELIEFKTNDVRMQEAQAYWLFCYFCSGCNPVDLCHFKYKNIVRGSFRWAREKTRNMKKDPPIICAPIDESLQAILDRYSQPKVNAETYIFPVLKKGLDAQEVRFLVDQFTRRCNDDLQRIAAELEWDFKPTLGYARCTAANLQRDAGIPYHVIQKNMGHTSITTTENYLGLVSEKETNDALLKLRMPKLKAV